MNYLFNQKPKEEFGFIYRYISPSNKSYIGQTINSLQQRAKNGHNYKNSTYFYNAIQKYGFENFSWEILGEFPIEILSKKEIYYIQLYNTMVPNGYNLRTEEQNLNYTNNNTKTKRCINKYDLQGNFIKQFDSIKDAAYDNGVKPEAISRCCRGITKRSGDYIYQYADSEKKVTPVSKYQKGTCPVVQYDLNMNLIAIYPSLNQAELAIKKKKGANNIRLVCKGERKMAYGFIWKLLSEVNINEHI